MRAYLQSKEQVFANIEERERQEKAIVQKAFEDSRKHQNTDGNAQDTGDSNNNNQLQGKNPKNLTDNSMLTKRLEKNKITDLVAKGNDDDNKNSSESSNKKPNFSEENMEKIGESMSSTKIGGNGIWWVW